MKPTLSIFMIKSGLSPIQLELKLTQNNLDEVSSQLPQGLYSTFRTFGSCEKVLGLKMHLDRLYEPASELGILPSASKDELRKALTELLEAYRPGDVRVRVSLSLTDTPGQIFVAVEHLKLLDETFYQKGIKVVTTQAVRTKPRLKSTVFIQNSKEERQAILRAGIIEALIVKNEHILEGLTSNFYAVCNRKIITSRYGILLGVTRRFVLRLARSAGIEIEYRPLNIHELPEIAEAFITSSSRGVVPVIAVNNIQIGDGRPGNVAKMLRSVYDVYVLKKAEHI
jgi:branched-subunit amino acid aminotransferase/4-amino-4-deoxychorismate lyase